MLDKEEREHQEDMINTYGGIPDCDYKNCSECSENQIEECYLIANNNCNSKYVESINYGGYDSKKEFWDNI